MPSTLKHPARVPMWRGVKAGYVVIALCLYPIAIGGFWAYGNMVSKKLSELQISILVSMKFNVVLCLIFNGSDTAKWDAYGTVQVPQ